MGTQLEDPLACCAAQAVLVRWSKGILRDHMESGRATAIDSMERWAPLSRCLAPC